MSKLTMQQAVVISGYTGVLACQFDVLHAEIEKRMGRPVWTHELGNHETDALPPGSGKATAGRWHGLDGFYLPPRGNW